MGSNKIFLRAVSTLVLICVGFIAIANNQEANNARSNYHDNKGGQKQQQQQQHDNGILHRCLRSSSLTTKKEDYTKHRQMQHTENMKDLSQNRSSILAVITEPKTGTGSLQSSLVHSYGCTKNIHKYSGDVGYFECNSNNENQHVIRTHSFEKGVDTVQALKKEISSASASSDNDNNRDDIDHDRDQCIILTAIRDPQTKFPSLFMEYNKEKMCDPKWAERYTPQYVLQMYKRWLVQHRQYAHFHPLPKLLREFGILSLVDAFPKMNSNGGYVKVPYPYNEYDQDTQRTRPFRYCDLIFLKLEDATNWNAILQKEIGQDVVYFSNLSREDRCPVITEHYKLLKEHTFTLEETKALTMGNPWMEDYFRLYGHNVGDTSNGELSPPTQLKKD